MMHFFGCHKCQYHYAVPAFETPKYVCASFAIFDNFDESVQYPELKMLQYCLYIDFKWCLIPAYLWRQSQCFWMLYAASIFGVNPLGYPSCKDHFLVDTFWISGSVEFELCRGLKTILVLFSVPTFQNRLLVTDFFKKGPIEKKSNKKKRSSGL